jgi:modulator of FtsH protease HflC
MKITRFFNIIASFIIVVIIFCTFNVRAVYPQQTMVIKSFDKPVRYVGNGIAVKLPFINTFMIVDNNIKRYDSKTSNVYTKDNRVLILGPTTLFKITDIKQYLITVKNESGAISRIEDTVYEITKTVFSKYTYADIVKNVLEEKEDKSLEIAKNETLSQIEAEIDSLAKEKIKDYGLTIESVVIPSIMLPEDNVKTVYNNITADRKRAADEVLNQGIKEANEYRAAFGKQIQLLRNEANLYKDQQISEGKAEAKKIYESVYEADAGFYSYYKTIKMYEEMAKNAKAGEMIMQIPSDSEIGKILLGE